MSVLSKSCETKKKKYCKCGSVKKNNTKIHQGFVVWSNKLFLWRKSLKAASIL